jgi:hypothetical protein
MTTFQRNLLPLENPIYIAACNAWDGLSEGGTITEDQVNIVISHWEDYDKQKNFISTATWYMNRDGSDDIWLK